MKCIIPCTAAPWVEPPTCIHNCHTKHPCSHFTSSTRRSCKWHGGWGHQRRQQPTTWALCSSTISSSITLPTARPPKPFTTVSPCSGVAGGIAAGALGRAGGSSPPLGPLDTAAVRRFMRLSYVPIFCAHPIHTQELHVAWQLGASEEAAARHWGPLTQQLSGLLCSSLNLLGSPELVSEPAVDPVELLAPHMREQQRAGMRCVCWGIGGGRPCLCLALVSN